MTRTGPGEAGRTVRSVSDEVEALAAEVARLGRALRRQGADRRRIQRAYERLRDEKRDTHELLAAAEQLQEDVERLEARVAFFEDGSLAQALRDAKRSKAALSARYGHLYRALTRLVEEGDVPLRGLRQPRQALRDVDDREWVKDELARLEAEKLATQEADRARHAGPGARRG